MGLPLSVARGVRLPGEAWTPRDWALAQAAKALDWSRCPGCGQPRWLAHDPKSSWMPRMTKCESCNAIEDLKETPQAKARLEAERSHPQAWHFHTEHVPQPTTR